MILSLSNEFLSISTYSKRKVLFIVSAFSIATLFTYKFVLISDSLYFNYFEERLRDEKIESILAMQKKYDFIGYLFVPVFLFLKSLIITCCIMCGLIFDKINVRTGEIFKVVLVSDLIFLIPQIVKIVWFGYFHPGYSLNDLQAFSPLSLANLVPANFMNGALNYPFQVFNLFEVLYWLILAAGISPFIQRSFNTSFTIILKTYVASLIMFLVIIILFNVDTQTRFY